MKKKVLSLHFSSSSDSDSYTYSNEHNKFEEEKVVPVKYPPKKAKSQKNVAFSHDSSSPNIFNSNNITKSANNDQNSDDENMKQNSPETKETNNNPNYMNYFCSRTSRAHIQSKLLFKFRQNNENLLFAKSKGVITNQVFIASYEDIHIKKKKYEFVLNISHHRHHYVLKNAKDDKELMIIDISTDYGTEYGPRKYEINWPEDHLKHLSRIPTKNQNGEWCLKFGGKFVIKSLKNCIILDENVKPSIIVRKVSKETLEVEVIRNYKPIFLFALALSSFICPD
ncbi:hypothetical protein TRFO_30964 [Tritrichomonas foetus]|uniref:Tubby C-terminal domain-containing protein n=1 Tax=Tritrichomonas foetus TaxID=1144522 RepID=A0A1J4JWU9_9EUKA|nr:hypothetical protein TRFO_30964 [Tritrichomonas foetus]|eukprot:OHT02012.1 hypothetical protein TRFO_30964 [Tritrichomonas foetus]